MDQTPRNQCFCKNRDSGYLHFDRPYSVKQMQIHLGLPVIALMLDEVLELSQLSNSNRTVTNMTAIDDAQKLNFYVRGYVKMSAEL